MIRVAFIGHWNTNEYVYRQFLPFTKTSDGKWNQIQLVSADEEYDFLNIVNHPREDVKVEQNRVIYWIWEPKDAAKNWGPWEYPSKSFPNLFASFEMLTHGNIVCWQINKSWHWLMHNRLPQKSKLISGVVSDKTVSPYGDMRAGRQRRISFIADKLSTIPEYEHFGMIHQTDSPISKLRCYRGAPTNKEDGLFPYKYTFAAENGCEKNYFTEKLIDAILSECFTFYVGHPSVEKFFDPRCFKRLNLTYMNNSLWDVKNGMDRKLWEQNIQFIRKEKHRILTQLSVFPILESLFFERGILPE